MTRLTEAELRLALATHEILSDTGATDMRKPVQPSSEHDEQVAVFQWADMNVGRWPCLAYMFAIPNGGMRATRTAVRLKAEGVKAGVPDIFLPWPVGSWCGLWVEMKHGSNSTTAQQRNWLSWLKLSGYHSAVCWGAEDAIRVIEGYLRGEAQ